MSDQDKNASIKSRGRPATGKGQQVVTRLHDDLLEPLDKFSAGQPDTPGRPEAIRRILRDWLIGNGYLRSNE